MIFASVGSQAESITGYSAGQGGKIYIHWRHGDRVLLILEISGGNQPHTSGRLAAVNSEQPPRSSLERSSETFNIYQYLHLLYWESWCPTLVRPLLQTGMILIAERPADHHPVLSFLSNTNHGTTFSLARHQPRLFWPNFSTFPKWDINNFCKSSQMHRMLQKMHKI